VWSKVREYDSQDRTRRSLHSLNRDLWCCPGIRYKPSRAEFEHLSMRVKAKDWTDQPNPTVETCQYISKDRRLNRELIKSNKRIPLISMTLYYRKQHVANRTQTMIKGIDYDRSPRSRRASWRSLGWMVTRLAWIAAKLVSSNKETR
jgi:hypothetical protein